jgi:dipeptidyl-peptidase-4
MKYWSVRAWRTMALVALVVVVCRGQRALAQDRVKTMPGYERYHKMRSEIPGAVKAGSLSVTWADGGKAFEYQKDGKKYRYDIASAKAEPVVETKEKDKDKEKAPAPPPPERRRGRRQIPGVERGRQAASATSPDGKLKAFHRDRNLWISDAKGGDEVAVTTEGNEKGRIKYGIASWVYGEELNQNTAMWWSPDSKKIAYYRFDESKVPDYFLQLDQTKLQDKMDIEPYPKVSAPNPIADVFIYDVPSKKSVRVDVRDGRPFENGVVGHYVYGISWSQSGKELLLHRTNRKQNVLEYVAADPETGKCRAVVHEEWTPSWVTNSPEMHFLKDGRRFVWGSQRTGFKNYYLYSLDAETSEPLALTNNEFEASGIIRIDEEPGVLYYMAHDGDNAMKLQLHRVGLDGKDDARLTDPAYFHSVDVAPDGKHFIDTIQTHDSPPVTRLVDTSGKVLTELAKSDTTKFEQLGLQKVELFTYKAGDGVTELHGILHKPSNFDPSKKYPLLVSVYAGPETNGARETFTTPNPLTEYGFLLASLDSRSAAGRGKRFTDAIYQHLGVVEMDDQAEGVKELAKRPYVDGRRVGMFGTSYGGYSSVMCLLRHPDVFQAASASSPVTDFRIYDSIYTERYMWLADENKAGYDAGSAMKYADKLKGRLMLYYGTADNNVHPSNSLQLIKALQAAGKSFEVQVGPDRGHTAINQDRMMEFFIENLVMKQPPVESAAR